MGKRPASVPLARETVKSVAAGLLGATLPALASRHGADPIVADATRDLAFDLLPAIFLNALMSSLVPAVLTLQRTASGRFPAAFAGPAAIVLCLAIGGTAAGMASTHLLSLARPLSGLPAAGVLLVRAAQAVLVAALVTPVTILAISARTARG